VKPLVVPLPLLLVVLGQQGKRNIELLEWILGPRNTIQLDLRLKLRLVLMVPNQGVKLKKLMVGIAAW
jgi:hypothetical protein